MRNAEGFLCVFFFAPILRGTRTAAGVFVPDGATLFLHRLSGVRELRKRVRPFWAGSFSLRFSGELRSAERGDSPRPAAGQEGRHQGFYPLNSHFLLFLSLAQTGDRRPLRKGERQRIFSTVGEHSVLPCRNLYAVPDTVLLHIRATLRRARHDSAAQFVSTL